jgi:hypothetical protein
MNIQGLAIRPNAGSGSSVGTSSSNLNALPDSARWASPSLGADTLDTPAATQDLSSGGLFMRLMQVYENQHPDEARSFLQGVADKLHAEAEPGSFSAQTLNVWGDKFQRAADTGDLSNLLPDEAPVNNLGVRAYQQVARSSGSIPPEVEAVLNDSVPPLANGQAPTGPGALQNAQGPAAATSGMDLDQVDSALAQSREAIADLIALSGAAVPALSSVLTGDLSPKQADDLLAANTLAATSDPNTVLQSAVDQFHDNELGQLDQSLSGPSPVATDLATLAAARTDVTP